MSERTRLETLSARDGLDVAKRWASRCADLYSQSITDPTHYASQPDWKPLFGQSIRELVAFAETGVISSPATPNRD